MKVSAARSSLRGQGEKRDSPARRYFPHLPLQPQGWEVGIVDTPRSKSNITYAAQNYTFKRVKGGVCTHDEEPAQLTPHTQPSAHLCELPPEAAAAAAAAAAATTASLIPGNIPCWSAGRAKPESPMLLRRGFLRMLVIPICDHENIGSRMRCGVYSLPSTGRRRYSRRAFHRASQLGTHV